MSKGVSLRPSSSGFFQRILTIMLSKKVTLFPMQSASPPKENTLFLLRGFFGVDVVHAHLAKRFPSSINYQLRQLLTGNGVCD